MRRVADQRFNANTSKLKRCTRKRPPVARPPR